MDELIKEKLGRIYRLYGNTPKLKEEVKALYCSLMLPVGYKEAGRLMKLAQIAIS